MRLIDADALREYSYGREDTYGDIKQVVDVEDIDNAPTVEPEVNCSHCDYFKFSRSFVENIVGFMLEHEIYTVDDLMTELNHINELNRVKDELGGENNEP